MHKILRIVVFFFLLNIFSVRTVFSAYNTADDFGDNVSITIKAKPDYISSSAGYSEEADSQLTTWIDTKLYTNGDAAGFYFEISGGWNPWGGDYSNEENLCMLDTKEKGSAEIGQNGEFDYITSSYDVVNNNGIYTKVDKATESQKSCWLTGGAGLYIAFFGQSGYEEPDIATHLRVADIVCDHPFNTDKNGDGVFTVDECYDPNSDSKKNMAYYVPYSSGNIKGSVRCDAVSFMNDFTKDPSKIRVGECYDEIDGQKVNKLKFIFEASNLYKNKAGAVVGKNERIKFAIYDKYYSDNSGEYVITFGRGVDSQRTEGLIFEKIMKLIEEMFSVSKVDEKFLNNFNNLKIAFNKNIIYNKNIIFSSLNIQNFNKINFSLINIAHAENSNDDISDDDKLYEQKVSFVKKFYRYIVLDNVFANTIRAFMLLYICFLGLNFAMGGFQYNVKEMMAIILKITFILAFTTERGWGLYNAYLVSFFLRAIMFTTTSLINMVNRVYTPNAYIYIPDGSSLSAIFTNIDSSVLFFFNDVIVRKIWSLFFSDWYGLLSVMLIFLTIFFFLIKLLTSTLPIMISYVEMMIALMLGPVFISLYLFKVTESIFMNWLAFLGARAANIVFTVLILMAFAETVKGQFVELLSFPIYDKYLYDIGLFTLVRPLFKLLFYWWLDIYIPYPDYSVTGKLTFMDIIIIVGKVTALVQLFSMIIAAMPSIIDSVVDIKGGKGGKMSSLVGGGSFLDSADAGMAKIFGGKKGQTFLKKTEAFISPYAPITKLGTYLFKDQLWGGIKNTYNRNKLRHENKINRTKVALKDQYRLLAHKTGKFGDLIKNEAALDALAESQLKGRSLGSLIKNKEIQYEALELLKYKLLFDNYKDIGQYVRDKKFDIDKFLKEHPLMGQKEELYKNYIKSQLSLIPDFDYYERLQEINRLIDRYEAASNEDKVKLMEELEANIKYLERLEAALRDLNKVSTSFLMEGVDISRFGLNGASEFQTVAGIGDDFLGFNGGAANIVGGMGIKLSNDTGDDSAKEQPKSIFSKLDEYKIGVSYASNQLAKSRLKELEEQLKDTEITQEERNDLLEKYKSYSINVNETNTRLRKYYGNTRLLNEIEETDKYIAKLESEKADKDKIDLVKQDRENIFKILEKRAQDGEIVIKEDKERFNKLSNSKIKELNRKLDEEKVSSLGNKERIESLKKKEESLIKRQKELDEKVENKKLINQDLEKKEELESKINKYSKKINNDLEKEKKEIEKLNKQLSDEKDRLKNLEEEKNKYIASYNISKEEQKILNDKVNEQKNTIQKLQSKINTKEKELKEFIENKKELVKIETTIAERLAAEDLFNKAMLAREEKKKAKDKKKKIREEIKKMEQENAKVLETIKKKDEEITEKQKVISQLKGEVEKLGGNISEKFDPSKRESLVFTDAQKMEKRKLISSILFFEKNKDNKEKELKEIRREIKELEKEKNVSGQIEDLEKREKYAKLQMQEREYIKTFEDYKKNKDRLNILEIDEKTKAYRKAELELKKLKDEKANEEKKISDYTKKQELEKTFTNDFKDKKAKKNRIEEKVEIYSKEKEIINEHKNLSESLKVKIGKYEAEGKRIAVESKELEKELKTVEVQLKSIEDREKKVIDESKGATVKPMISETSTESSSIVKKDTAKPVDTKTKPTKTAEKSKEKDKKTSTISDDKKFKQEKEELTKKAQEIKEKMEANKESDAKNKALREDIENDMKKISTLKNEFDTLENRKKQINESEQLSTRKEEIKNKQIEIKQNKVKFDTQNKEIIELQESIEKNKKLISEGKADTKELEEKNQQMAKRITEIQETAEYKEYKKQENTLKELDKQIQHIEEQEKTIKAIEDLQLQKQNLEKKLKEIDTLESKQKEAALSTPSTSSTTASASETSTPISTSSTITTASTSTTPKPVETKKVETPKPVETKKDETITSNEVKTEDSKKVKAETIDNKAETKVNTSSKEEIKETYSSKSTESTPTESKASDVFASTTIHKPTEEVSSISTSSKSSTSASTKSSISAVDNVETISIPSTDSTSTMSTASASETSTPISVSTSTNETVVNDFATTVDTSSSSISSGTTAAMGTDTLTPPSINSTTAESSKVDDKPVEGVSTIFNTTKEQISDIEKAPLHYMSEISRTAETSLSTSDNSVADTKAESSYNAKYFEETKKNIFTEIEKIDQAIKELEGKKQEQQKLDSDSKNVENIVESTSEDVLLSKTELSSPVISDVKVSSLGHTEAKTSATKSLKSSIATPESLEIPENTATSSKHDIELNSDVSESATTVDNTDEFAPINFNAEELNMSNFFDDVDKSKFKMDKKMEISQEQERKEKLKEIEQQINKDKEEINFDKRSSEERTKNLEAMIENLKKISNDKIE